MLDIYSSCNPPFLKNLFVSFNNFSQKILATLRMVCLWNFYVSCRVQLKFSFQTEIKPLPSNMVGFGLEGMPSLTLNIAILIKNRITSLKAEKYLNFGWLSTTWRCWISVWLEDAKAPGGFSNRQDFLISTAASSHQELGFGAFWSPVKWKNNRWTAAFSLPKPWAH